MGDDTQHPERKYARIYTEVPVFVSTPTSGGVTTALLTRQLGLGGCMLVGTEYFEAGRVLTLKFALDAGEARAISQVLYEYPHDGLIFSGLKFIDLTNEDSMLLDSFIRYNLSHGKSSRYL